MTSFISALSLSPTLALSRSCGSLPHTKAGELLERRLSAAAAPPAVCSSHKFQPLTSRNGAAAPESNLLPGPPCAKCPPAIVAFTHYTRYHVRTENLIAPVQLSRNVCCFPCQALLI